MSKRHTREIVDRVARVYSSNLDASTALRVTPRSFARLCNQYGIETPYGRKRRLSAEALRPRQTSGQEEDPCPGWPRTAPV